MYNFTGESLNVIITGDIHINLKKYTEFERDRLHKLKTSLMGEVDSSRKNILILNGDILDRSKPTYEEISEFYSFVTELSKYYDEIFVISGNHEETTKEKTLYDYIPEFGFKYIKVGNINVGNVTLWLVGHPYLDMIDKLQPKNKINLLISHYRSDIGVADEEVSNSYVSETFDYTILSDIHEKMSPKENIEYTSSPYTINFRGTDLSPFIGGYTKVLVDDNSYDVFSKVVSLPNKFKIVIDFEKLEHLSLNSLKYLKEYIDKTHLYKVEVINFPVSRDKESYSEVILSEFSNITSIRFFAPEESYSDAVEDIIDEITERSDEGLFNVINNLLEKDGIPKDIINTYSETLKEL